MAETVQYQSGQSDVGEPARSPIVELLLLGGPTVAQMASYTLMQFFDTMMLGHVGTGVVEPTAGSNAGMIAFSIISLAMGTLFVVNTLVSQSFGRKDAAPPPSGDTAVAGAIFCSRPVGGRQESCRICSRRRTRVFGSDFALLPEQGPRQGR